MSTIVAPPAVVNAVADALSSVGVRRLDMPLTAESGGVPSTRGTVEQFAVYLMPLASTGRRLRLCDRTNEPRFASVFPCGGLSTEVYRHGETISVMEAVGRQ